MNTVTGFTKDLLGLRATDDYRIGIIYDIMYGEDFGGSRPNREFEFEGDNGKKVTATLRKAKIMDSLQYFKVPNVEDMTVTIENNISNIQNMKKNGGVGPGFPPIKNVWVLLFTTNKNGEDLSMNAYFNPNANDCSDIIHSERTICLASFVIEYDVKQGEEHTDVLEFTFLSPMDENNINEYQMIAIEEEAKMLQNTFLIKFDHTKLFK